MPRYIAHCTSHYWDEGLRAATSSNQTFTVEGTTPVKADARRQAEALVGPKRRLTQFVVELLRKIGPEVSA